MSIIAKPDIEPAIVPSHSTCYDVTSVPRVSLTPVSVSPTQAVKWGHTRGGTDKGAGNERADLGGGR